MQNKKIILFIQYGLETNYRGRCVKFKNPLLALSMWICIYLLTFSSNKKFVLKKNNDVCVLIVGNFVRIIVNNNIYFFLLRYKFILLCVKNSFSINGMIRVMHL